MSPYLFVIAIEIFTRLMQQKVQPPMLFKFHLKFSKFTAYLSFADDLIDFSGADLDSIKFIKDELDEFKNISELFANSLKKSFLCLRAISDLKKQLLAILNFKEGRLLVRYSGVPSTFGKSNASYCKPLIDRITAKISYWCPFGTCSFGFLLIAFC